MLVMLLLLLLLGTTSTLASWSLAVTRAPWPLARRSPGCACWDGDLFVVGGRGQSARLNDVWRRARDSDVWLPLPRLPDTGLSGSQVWVDADANALLVHGGRADNGAASPRTWRLALDTLQWAARATGPARYGAAVFARQRLKCFFGGTNASVAPTEDVYCYDPRADAWSGPLALGGLTAPGPRDDAATTSSHGQMWLLGGEPADADQSIYSLDTDALTWARYSAAGSLPSARSDAVLAAVGEVLVLHGGRTAAGALVTDVASTLRAGLWAPLTTAGPGPRWGAGGCSDGTTLAMFGGANAAGSLLEELWTYDASPVVLPTTAPAPTLPPLQPLAVAALVLALVALVAMLLVALVVYHYHRSANSAAATPSPRPHDFEL